MFTAGPFSTAWSLILSFNRDVYAAVWTSVSVASWSTLVASVIGIPVGIVAGSRDFRGKRGLVLLLNTLMAMPTVVIGLVVFGFLSRQGPLGGWGLLFTPNAMIVGQTILAVPIVANYTLSAVTGADARILPTVLTLGGSHVHVLMQLTREVRFGVMAAVIAGFGRVIAEVGVAMMLGGNIQGYTRTMTTAIALETSKGEFAFGLALGIILIAVAFAINLALNLLQESAHA